MIADIYNTILFEPIFNLLVWFYNVLPGPDVGLAIIVLTIIIKAVLYPFSVQSIKSQKAMQEIQPKIEDLRKKFKDQKEKLSQEMMALYKREKVNPFSSCLPLLIQLPFLIAVFQVFRQGFDPATLNLLYPFIENPGQINPTAFGFLNLGEPNIPLAVLAGVAQFWQAKMLTAKKKNEEIKKDDKKQEGTMAIMNKQMQYMMPIITVIIGVSLPGGLMLYWFLVTLLTVAQQYLVFGREKEDVQPPSSPPLLPVKN